MKKATMILIGIVYLASIVIISIFGMKSVVYNEIIPVSKIECLNETDSKSEVTDSGNKKIIKVKYTTPGNAETLTGTMVQLSWRVLPDNATTKNVKFIYDETLTRVKFIKDEKGNELGLILFTGKSMFDVRIMSTDGTRIYQDVTIWAY